MPPPARSTKAEARRARAEAARLAAARAQRRRRWIRIGLVAGAVLVIAAITGVIVAGGSHRPAHAAAAPTSSPPTSTSAPSGPATADWALPADASAAATRAGLPMLGQEMLAVHYHAHLDVLVRGQTITVPAHIGIDEVRQRISALHTHDTSGVVHIESAQDIPYTLGQLFTEWGQPLTTSQVGPVHVQTGEQVRVYRNGTLVSGDPAALKFAAHDEIVVWLGPASQQPQVPTGYSFPNGL
jgi:hypothetical protein